MFMTLVGDHHRPLVLVLLHTSGREEWPFSGGKLFSFITLGVNYYYWSYLEGMHIFAQRKT